MKKLLIFVVLITGFVLPGESFSETRKINGYWKISLMESLSSVKKTCGVYLQEIEKEKMYRFTMFDYFDTKNLAQIANSKKSSPIAYAYMPLKGSSLFFSDEKLVIISMSFAPNLFGAVKKTITDNWGNPNEVFKMKSAYAGKWIFEGSCVILRKFKTENNNTVVELDIKKISLCGK